MIRNNIFFTLLDVYDYIILESRTEESTGFIGLNLKDIALRVDRPAKTVERYLKILKDLSLIEFRGAPRNGKYYSMKS